ncbi:oleate hydratase, partial [Enterococcus faecalis]|uniref:oleate hydratase n=1 Tax=Enterococcus faecalis TaxID=1351 RepID=UPI0022A6996C
KTELMCAACHAGPNSSNCRIIHNRSERVPGDGQFTLSKKAQKEIIDLFMTSEDQLIGCPARRVAACTGVR